MIFKLANWNAPKNISALSTTRLSGSSQDPFASNNLALHVEDNPEHVMQNRQALMRLLNLPAEPVWLEQTHSTLCVIPDQESSRQADAATTTSLLHPLVILTADCLPITLCSKQGDEIAAIHAGWRGLFNGIIEHTLGKMSASPLDLMAWIGPSICQKCYEIGDEVYAAFTQKYPGAQNAFEAVGTKWLANLPLIAEMILRTEGVPSVSQSGLCTFESNNAFYSYRKTAKTGRIATLIWFRTPTD